MRAWRITVYTLRVARGNGDYFLVLLTIPFNRTLIKQKRTSRFLLLEMVDPIVINLGISVLVFGLVYVAFKLFASPTYNGRGATAAAPGGSDKKGKTISCHSMKQFRELIDSGDPTIVDFTATWCSPCQYVKPTFVKLSLQYPEAHFVTVDVDELPDVKDECQVKAMPTFQFYRRGQRVDEMVGADTAKLTSKVGQLCKK